MADESDHSAESFALEILFWQLVTAGVLRAAPLAAELDRYSRYSSDGGKVLRTLAAVVRAAHIPQVVSDEASQ